MAEKEPFIFEYHRLSAYAIKMEKNSSQLFIRLILIWTFALIPIITYAEILDFKSEASQNSDGDETFMRGLDLFKTSKFADAEKLFLQAEQKLTKEYGTENRKTLTAIFYLARTYYELKQVEKALALHTQVLNARILQFGKKDVDTLESMDDTSNCLRYLGNWEKAESLFNESKLIKLSSRLGDNHPETLKQMKTLAIAYHESGEYIKASDLEQIILENNKIRFGKINSITIESMLSLAETMRLLGDFKKARSLLKEIIEIQNTNLLDNDLNLRIEAELANILIQQGEYAQAQSIYERILVFRRNKFGDDHRITLTTMNNLAVVLFDQGKYLEAAELQEKLVLAADKKYALDDSARLSLVSNLALTYRYLGQFDKSIVLNKQILEIRLSNLGENHPKTLISMNNLADVYAEIGQYELAFDLNSKVYTISSQSLGKKHPTTIDSMNNLANNYLDLNQPKKALPIFSEALVLLKELLGDNHPSTLKSMSNLAENYVRLNQNDEAIKLNIQTLNLKRSILGFEHPDTLITIDNLAVIYFRDKKYSEALNLLEESYMINNKRFGETYIGTLESMNRMAQLYEKTQQSEKYFDLIPRIVKGVEKIRSLPDLKSEDRSSLFSMFADNYQTYASWYGLSNQLEQAFVLADLSKARTLSENIVLQAALRSLPLQEQKKIQDYETKLSVLRDEQLRMIKSDSQNLADLRAINRKISEQQAQYLELFSTLSQQHSNFNKLNINKSVNPSNAKDLLNKNEVFISFLVTKKGFAQVFVIDSNEKITWVNLGSILNLSSTIKAYKELIENDVSHVGYLVSLKEGGFQWLEIGQPMPEGSTAVAYDRHLIESYLHNFFIEPILPFVESHNRWVISPDKDLALLPFDVLIDFNKNGEVPFAPQLISRNITLVQSFNVFSLLKSREREYSKLHRSKQLFAMGNPTYIQSDLVEEIFSRGRKSRGFTINRSSNINSNSSSLVLNMQFEQALMQQLKWINLPGTEKEIRNIAQIFNQGSNKLNNIVDIFLREDASELKLRELNSAGKLKDYKYLLFSVHGYLAQNSSLSSIVLSQQNLSPEIDGYITANEWPLYDIKSDLTVLSACDTGVGKIQAGESVLGLPYALFVAGNKNTLLTLWPVDDDATAEFMTRFFNKLSRGINQSDALRETKQEFLLHPLWNKPKYWSAFVLYGV